MAIDGQGRFLFVSNPTSDDISMFQIDPASGALSEVPGSPFAVPTISPNTPAPSQPLSIAAEKSGKFLFVGYFFAFNGSPGPSSVASLAIDTSGSSPVLLPIESILTMSGGAPIQLLTDSKGLHLYVGLGIGPNRMLVGGAEVYSIDSASGNLLYQGLADDLPSFGRDYAIDPHDRFFFAGGGDVDFLQSCLISPVDGTANNCPPFFYLGFTNNGMLAESSGHFLYIADSPQSVVVYSIDQFTGALTQLGSLTGIFSSKGSFIADPMGPYIYTADQTIQSAVHAYQIDQQTGNLTEISGSPFNPGVPSTTPCCQGLAVSGNSVQAISGPAVTIFPSSADTFNATAGSSSATQIFSIVNAGDQLLGFSSISIAGVNASTFSQTNTCLATLAPNGNCSVSITFNPPGAGAFSASLQVADNAPGSPQTLVLNGTGLAAAPAVTFSPASPSFPSTTQGTSSAPQTLTVISSGNTSLNISAVSLAGPNPSDFSFTNNCSAPLQPGANCTIIIAFSPIASGQRTANLLISDDALGSPQTIVLSGTGIALVPALSLSPPVPSFPATTQGTSSAPQTLTVINSGNATLQISSVSLSGSNAAEFSLNSDCAAPLAPAAGCSISLVFSPVTLGQSTATLTIADDAPGSPQTVSFSAAASPAFSVTAATSSSLSASVSAGQTAQYHLQLTPAAGFAGVVSLSCSGAPLGASCQVPPSVSLANGATATFTVSVATSGTAAFLPSAPLHFRAIPAAPISPFVVFLLLLLLFAKNDRAFGRPAGKNLFAFYGIPAAAILCVFFSLSGCGGGSAAIAPQVIATPSGISTITITLGAMSPSGQPLQLQPIQLNLTVK